MASKGQKPTADRPSECAGSRPFFEAVAEGWARVDFQVAAWNAMEIFVNATFKSTYEVQWSQIIEKGASVSAKPVVERIAEVMKDKYRLADKFLIIASILDPVRAATDEKEFRRLKKVRDGLLHVLDMPTEPLPTEAAQSLLLKFMGLHLRAPSR
jgi:hypothetical protein